MGFVLLAAVIATVLAIALLALVPIPERELTRGGDGVAPQALTPPATGAPQETTAEGKRIDIPGTIRAVKAVRGLFALIFFSTFNNFLGGVFLIGPVAQWTFIPFMTTGAGVQLIGGWFGAGVGRGIALVFMTAGPWDWP